MKRLAFIAGGIGIVAWLFSGMYSVGPSQRGIQTFMGRPASQPTTPGLHIHAPWPFGGVTLVDVSRVRSLTIKFEWPNEPGHKCYLLTGDENVVELEFQVHYVVDAPVTYLYVDKAPQVVLAMAARSDAVALLARMGVDDALTIGRPVLAARIKQRLADNFAARLGVKITSVLITKLTPPVQVRSAFAAVASAKADQARRINDAYGDRNRRVPRARADALRKVTVAQAKAREMTGRVAGWISAFHDLLRRYQAAPKVTKAALVMEKLPEILKKTGLTVLDPSKISDVFLGGNPPQVYQSPKQRR